MNGFVHRSNKPHYVYRCYDAAGDLLYIGYTVDPRARMAQHRCRSGWFEQVVRTRFLVFPNRFEAERQEGLAISAERPRHNKQGFRSHLRDAMHPGSAIRAMRQGAGLSLAQLAELSGASIGYLSDVENGKREPSARWLRDVNEALASSLQEDGAA